MPRVSRVDLPASPLRAPSGRALAASLGYAAALSTDGTRLYVARHALGAMGKEAWFGAATVDVLTTADDAPLAPPHVGRAPFLRGDKGKESEEIKLPGTPLAPFTQPRAIAYRRSTQTILVLGEGDDRLVELDALSADPTLALLRTHDLGGARSAMNVATTGAAPVGLALSEDEGTAWVFCHGSYDLLEVKLDADPVSATGRPAPPRVLHLADDPEGADVNLGRRMFYGATDPIASGGLGCAACHPEGRDDGFTWREAKFNTQSGTGVNFVSGPEQVPDEEHVKGYPRRTPQLAGRVASSGPYGWHAESPDLADRVSRGFALHRWGAMPKHGPEDLAARSGALVAFLRRGLVPPPREAHPETPEEKRGHQIFLREEVGCARCHAPATGYTDRVGYALPSLPLRPGFDEEHEHHFKTPSLLFVGGRAPLLHDGSAASIEDVLERNNDRMGKTSHLSREDRAALAAFLRTL
jgi:cytochrome c peroxidase